MTFRYLLVLNFYILFRYCGTNVLNSWHRFIQNPGVAQLLSFRRASQGVFISDAGSLLRTYSRGFPRGIWGTFLFPDIYKAADANATGSSFWSKYDNLILDKNSSIEPSFREFRDAIRGDFCTKDDSKRWECCDEATHPSCSTIPSNAKAIQTMMEDPEIDISLAFAYIWCTKAWKYFKRINGTAQMILLKNIIQGCPDPCFGNPCRTVKGVKDNICTITGTFENDYKCNCLDDMLWDENLLICQPVNPCDRKVYKACVPENTLQCIAFDISTYQCICKSEYMGIDCSLPRDACTERVDKSQPNGDTNCQIQLGNICQPILGTDYYTCQCLSGYQPLLHIPEPNCLGRIDPCLTIQLTDLLTQTSITNDSEVINQLDQNESKPLNPDMVIHWGLTCLNGGQCVASADFTRASCVCPTASDGSLLYTGLNCEYPVGIWSTWTLPSPCFPEDCGVTRYRWRRRYCLNGTTSEDLLPHMTESSQSSTELNGWTYSHRRMPIACPGTSEEILPCPELEPCLKLRLPGYMREEIFSYNSLYYFLYVTIVIFVFSCLMWYVFGSTIARYLKRKYSE